MLSKPCFLWDRYASSLNQSVERKRPTFFSLQYLFRELQIVMGSYHRLRLYSELPLLLVIFVFLDG